MEISGFYREVIEKFNENGVEFLLVGGLAVGFYGYARYTGDMDLWINPSQQNLARLGKSLSDLKYTQDVIDEILTSRPVDHPTPIRLFSEDDQLKIDLMTSILYEPLTFSACRERAVSYDLGGHVLPVIGIRDLIEIKRNVKRYDGNLKDLVDAEELLKILDRREPKARIIEHKPSLLQRMLKYLGKN